MELKYFIEFITESVNEISSDIEKLYSGQTSNKRSTLNHLNSEVMMLQNYIKHFRNSDLFQAQETSDPNQNKAKPSVDRGKTFTPEELAAFNGKNGNPAYIAVNGVVYDVTGIAAWAAATHFGQQAGNDLTSAFNACHKGEDILSRLPMVGTLI